MIHSKKRSFEEYKKQTEAFRATQDKSAMLAYDKFLEEDIIPGTVFYLNYNRHGNHERGNAIVKALTEQKVYSSFLMRNDFSDEKHIQFVKKKSDDFHKRLATSEYIITDSVISPYYVKRKGQCVINILDNCEAGTSSSKAAIGRQVLKSDIIVADTQESGEKKIKDLLGNTWCFSGQYMSDKELIQLIQEGKKIEGTKDETKKTTAIVANFDASEIWIPRLYSIVNKIDMEQEYVILILDNTLIEELSGYLSNLPSNITVVTRQGWFLVNEKIQETYAYIKSDLMFLEDFNEIFDYVGKEIYQREFERIIGNTKVDELIILGDCVSLRRYWYMMGSALNIAKKTIAYDNSTDKEFLVQDRELSSAYEQNMRKIYENFHEILFWGEAQKQEYLDGFETSETLDSKARTVVIDEYIDYQLNTLEFDLLGKRAIAYNIFNGQKKMDVMKLPKSGYDVIAIENDEECRIEYVNKIEQLVKENGDKEFLLIDLNDISKSMYSTIVDANPKLNLYRGAIFFKVALQNAEKVFVSAKNERLLNLLLKGEIKKDAIEEI